MDTFATILLLLPIIKMVMLFGAVIMSLGCYFVYTQYGTWQGHVASAFSAVVLIVLGIIGVRAAKSKRFSLQEVVDSQMNTDDVKVVHVGDEGISASALRPAGTALFDLNKLEVTTLGEFVDEGIPVVVIKVDKRKIFVKPINTD